MSRLDESAFHAGKLAAFRAHEAVQREKPRCPYYRNGARRRAWNEGYQEQIVTRQVQQMSESELAAARAPIEAWLARNRR
ncbi:MAG: hypothetical protein V4773_27850 [Verrucomicrobiota bacterium]